MASLPEAERLGVLQSLSDEDIRLLAFDWRFWARPNQIAPEGDWLVWLLMAGRGFGKTRSGAQWTHERAMAGGTNRWIALIGYDPDEVRDVMVEGPSGILRNAPPWERPLYEPSKRRLTWPTGSYAKVYSSEDPEELRGFSGDTSWLDEPAKYKNLQAVYENLLFGLREAKVEEPRLCMTTTPKPSKIIKQLLADPFTAITTGTSYENRENLSEKWFRMVVTPREGTALGQQEIYGKLLEQMPGAQWQRAWIENARVRVAPKDLRRIVIAVDPPGGERTECGIVAAGLQRGEAGNVFVLDDASLKASPEVWAKKVVEVYHAHRADAIVAEKNFGGDMVASTIRTADKNVPIKLVTASRGKTVRAEPVAALYERGKIHHVRDFGPLEDELCTYEADAGFDSPNRLDALVWAVTDLIFGSGESLEGMELASIEQESPWRI